MNTYSLKNHYPNPLYSEKLKGTYLDQNSYDLVIDHDADGYDMNGNLLFRFRKGALPFDVIKLGYDSFKDSIRVSLNRGAASGGKYNPQKKDGTFGKTAVNLPVMSGNVGFMDENALARYCRKTAFAREYFEKYQAGIPFVEYVDGLYRDLCPEHHARQLAIARGTNRNYRIADTSFTTVTVNENFRTAVHKDTGDFPQGFGNLCCYREGHYDGAFFCLPEYRVAVDLQTTDMLFVDVHKWHGNTPFENMSEDYLRISFVMYYREYMYKCKAPREELKRVQKDSGGFLKL